jgi:hypothetical protein
MIASNLSKFSGFCFAVLYAASITAAPALAKPKGASSGARAIIGNTVHGSDNEGEFYDYYAPNGTAHSRLVGGDTTHGRWTIRNGNICLNYPNDTPACYRVELHGPSLTMTDISSGESFQTQLLRGNPQGL